MPIFEWLNKRFKIHRNFYRESIEHYPPGDVRTMRWNSKESQLLRFNSLLRIGDLSDATILDIGCGTGDFLEFLDFQGTKYRSFTGIDLMNDFINVAQKRFPNHLFLQGDYFSHNFTQSYDYAFCNGALNVREEDNLALLLKFIKKTLTLSLKAVGVTLLKEAFGYLPDEKIFHYNENIVRDLLSKEKLNFQIYNDYTENDFTVFIYK